MFADGDFFKSGYLGQGLYVSPDRDLVIVYFSTNRDGGSIQGYLRPIAKRFRPVNHELTLGELTAMKPPADLDAIVRKVAWPLIPVLFVAYVINFIDRVNISFASL